MTPRAQAKTDLAGILLFLLPLCAVMLWTSTPYALQAWKILEGSRETGGIPALFLLKTIIPLSALLLGAQALAQAAKAIKTLKK
jgi:TRAP-type mannitol/chloroaromatic compound transport system permease small subunit